MTAESHELETYLKPSEKVRITHLLRKLLGLLHHALDLLVAQAALLSLDGDLLLLARALVLSGNIQDAVGVHLECHLQMQTGGIAAS